MELKTSDLRTTFVTTQRRRRSRHNPVDRAHPSLWQYDYLTLRTLQRDIVALLEQVTLPASTGRALDVGCDKSPYRDLLAERGYVLETLDVTPARGVDHVGIAEATGLPEATFDLVLCTQVLEHSTRPWIAMRELRRIVKPGGYVLFSAPHVWFFHPHPADNWRFTQEGMIRLCEEGALSTVSLRSQGGTLLTVAQIVNFLVYGALGSFGAPAYALTNLIAPMLDRLLPNDLFCVNFACLAQRTM